ncbi:hypothetical protein [Chroococcidiopsis sp. CCMEE 29]|nr:hypothetical protein [Chroococcidiopsis sp. CCMEE 29]
MSSYPETELQSAMERSQLRRYVSVQSEDYAAIATMYDTAIRAGYERLG